MTLAAQSAEDFSKDKAEESYSGGIIEHLRGGKGTKVAALRRALGGAKTGHAGTLDPFATGLLLVLVGKATKAQRQMMELRKRYQTLARLGAVSSTGDTEGEITETGRIPADRSKIGQPPLPTGELRQRPP